MQPFQCLYDSASKLISCLLNRPGCIFVCMNLLYSLFEGAGVSGELIIRISILDIVMDGWMAHQSIWIKLFHNTLSQSFRLFLKKKTRSINFFSTLISKSKVGSHTVFLYRSLGWGNLILTLFSAKFLCMLLTFHFGFSSFIILSFFNTSLYDYVHCTQ